jgi:branched-chain amino acid aminotransferase
MIVNFNGAFFSSEQFNLSINNRGFKFGDSVFDTLKADRFNCFFLEDHYFRLMASMRMLRMEIPMNFSPGFFKDQIIETLKANKLEGLSRIRFSVFRRDGGYYLPDFNEIDFLVEATALEKRTYVDYEIELYKDFQIISGLLSSIKTNNKILQVLGSIYAKENGYQNCLLLNERKQVVEACNGNLFVVKEGLVRTPAIGDGCVNGIIRKKVLEVVSSMPGLRLEESAINPMDLLQADEVFLTNCIMDIQSVSIFRKKQYVTGITDKIREKFGLLVEEQLG